MPRGIRPGDEVMYSGVHCKVASVYKGEAEVTSLSGTFIEFIPVVALNRVHGTGGKQHKSGGHVQSGRLMQRQLNDD